jgi:hypothetical protein
VVAKYRNFIGNALGRFDNERSLGNSNLNAVYR